MLRIGIDVGGVLASLTHSGEYPINANRIMQNWQIQGHLLAIVSQCGKARQIDTEKYLVEHNCPVNARYYINFKEKTKRRLIKQLELDVLIDDRAKHGLQALELGCQWLHFTNEPIHDTWLVKKHLYHHVTNWNEVEQVVSRWS